MLSVSSHFYFQHRGTEVQSSQREIFPLLYPLLGRGRGGFCVFPCSLSNVLHNYPSCSSPLDKGVGGWKSYQSATSASYYPHLLMPHMSFLLLATTADAANTPLLIIPWDKSHGYYSVALSGLCRLHRKLLNSSVSLCTLSSRFGGR